MITAIDTNIFSVLWADVAESHALAGRLDECRRMGALLVCPAVYAELLANPGMNEDRVNRFLQEAEVIVEFGMAKDIWVVSGRRYAAYANRRRNSGGGEPKRLLAHFIVGSHALVQADRLMTLDAGRYARDFPELKLI